MIGTAAAIIGGSVIGGATSLIGGKKAASASASATRSTVAENARQFDTVRSDTAPAREIGNDAISRLRSVFLNGDMSGFTQDPGRQFALQEGQRAIDNSLVARGRGLSGAGVKAGVRYATGMADQQFGSYFDRLSTLAGFGSTGVAQSAAAGANAANSNSQAFMQNGANRASSYMNTANGVNNAIQGGMSNYLLTRYLTPTTGGG